MSLKDWVTPFKVGLLVLAGIGAAIFMLTRLTSDGVNTDDYIKVHAYFSDVTGLAVKSRIRMAGIAVGEIDKIALEGKRARVDLLVREDIELQKGIEATNKEGVTFYKNGAVVAKKQASLIGDYYLELTPGEEGGAIPDGGEVRNVNEGMELDAIFSKLNQIATDIQNVTGALSTVLGGEEGARNLEQILTDLQQILSTINNFVGEQSLVLADILRDANVTSNEVREVAQVGNASIQRILGESETVVRDARAIVQEVRYVIGQSSDDVQQGIGTLSGTLVRLQGTLDSLNYSLQNIQDITDKVNEGEGTLGALVNDPAIAEKTNSILGDTQEFVGQIARLRTIVQLRSELHFAASQFKNVLGIKIEPNRNKFYLIEIVDDFRGQLAVTTVSERNPQTGNIETRQTRTVTDDFKLSLQLGQSVQLTSWLALTGRFGIIEGSGGLGGNIMFFDDRRLNIQMDVFDFAFNNSPRFRMFASYDVLPYLSVMAGVDDFFNPQQTGIPGRDVFMGLSIQFDDQDLKALIATAGVPSP